MCELCKLGPFCVEMTESGAGVLVKNKRINLQKVLLVVVNDHCGQKPGCLLGGNRSSIPSCISQLSVEVPSQITHVQSGF